jgi:hypothetical protein
MRVTWTKDVSLEDLRKLGAELGSDFAMEIDGMPRSYKSAAPPSWVRFYAENDWWIKGLGAYAAIYVAELVREAAKDTWKNRRKIVSAAVVAGGRVRQLAVALASLRKRLAPDTRIEIALPFPDDFDGTILELVGTDADELAVECAVFVHYLPALMNLIREEGLSRGSVATGIQLVMLDDLSLEVSWQDGSLQKRTRVLTILE